MTSGAILVASLLAALAQPSAWLLALATFLLRGGIVLVVAPILVLPSAVGLSNVFAPMATSLVFGGPSTELVVLALAVVLLALTWLIVGGLLSGATETWLITAIRPDDVGLAGEAWRPDDAPARRAAPRILAVRVVGHLPTVLALAGGTIRIVQVAYGELTLPTEVSTPLVFRVLLGAPEAVAAIVIAWAFGEVVGVVAARRIVIGEESAPTAVVRAVGSVLRRPVRSVVLFGLPGLALLAVLVASGATASSAWHVLQAALSFSGDPLEIGFDLLVFLVLWVGGLVVTAVVCTWRATAWTLVARLERPGTFGVARTRREGDWKPGLTSATLGDPRSRGADQDAR